MIVFAHIEFGLIRIKESGVKRGGGGGADLPQSEREFKIPVRIGLTENNSNAYLQNFISFRQSMVG